MDIDVRQLERGWKQFQEMMIEHRSVKRGNNLSLKVYTFLIFNFPLSQINAMILIPLYYALDADSNGIPKRSSLWNPISDESVSYEELRKLRLNQDINSKEIMEKANGIRRLASIMKLKKDALLSSSKPESRMVQLTFPNYEILVGYF